MLLIQMNVSKVSIDCSWKNECLFLPQQEPDSNIAGASAGIRMREQNSSRDEDTQHRASPALWTHSAAWGTGTWQIEASRNASDWAVPSQGAPKFYLFPTTSRTEEHTIINNNNNNTAMINTCIVVATAHALFEIF